MNILSRMLRKFRIRSLPPGLEASLRGLSPEDRAMALIHAVDYCLSLRRDFPDLGTMLSLALLKPDNLTSEECESLYFNLEEVCLQMKSARLSASEYKAMLDRYGGKFAENYKRTTEATSSLYGIGLAILMTRLSYRLSRLHSKVNQLHTGNSPYSRISVLLREAVPYIRRAAEEHNKVSTLTMPEKAWSGETTEFVADSANIIAISYPG